MIYLFKSLAICILLLSCFYPFMGVLTSYSLPVTVNIKNKGKDNNSKSNLIF
jgi:hypothetical protein